MELIFLFGFLFFCGTVYNCFVGDTREASVSFLLSIACFAICWSRTRKPKAVTSPIMSDTEEVIRCCRCGSKHAVRRRAYLLTYSIIFFTNKSSGSFRYICDSCSVFAGLPYSFLTFLLGWWGIPWGPLYTVQSIIRNFRGGVVFAADKTK